MGNTVSIMVYIKPDVKELLEAEAERRKMSLSTFMQVAALAFVELGNGKKTTDN